MCTETLKDLESSRCVSEMFGKHLKKSLRPMDLYDGTNLTRTIGAMIELYSFWITGGLMWFSGGTLKDIFGFQVFTWQRVTWEVLQLRIVGDV